jgi:hypothetical protein
VPAVPTVPQVSAPKVDPLPSVQQIPIPTSSITGPAGLPPSQPRPVNASSILNAQSAPIQVPPGVQGYHQFWSKGNLFCGIICSHSDFSFQLPKAL